MAKALTAAGRPTEAADAAGEAVALYQDKGDRPGMALARGLLDAL